jgi:hypothetical protein
MARKITAHSIIPDQRPSIDRVAIAALAASLSLSSGRIEKGRTVNRGRWRFFGANMYIDRPCQLNNLLDTPARANNSPASRASYGPGRYSPGHSHAPLAQISERGQAWPRSIRAGQWIRCT